MSDYHMTSGVESSKFANLRRYDLELDRVRLLAMRALRLIDHNALNAQLAQLSHSLAQLPPTRIDQLAARLSLDHESLQFLWTVMAADCDPQTALYIERLAGHRGGVSIATHATIVGLAEHSSRRLASALHSQHPLLRSSLIMSTSSGQVAPAVARATCDWHSSVRLASFLSGSDDIDHELSLVGGLLLPPINPVVSASQRDTVDLLRHLFTSETPVIVLEGSQGSGRRTLAAMAAAGTQHPLLHIDMTLRDRATSIDSMMAAVMREVCLQPDLIVMFANVDDLIDAGSERNAASLRTLGGMLAEITAPVVLTTSTPGMNFATTKTPFRIRVEPADASERKQLWQRALPNVNETSLHDISFRYRVGPGVIERAAANANMHALSRGASVVEHGDIVAGIRSTIDEKLSGLAQRYQTKAVWSDVVLSVETDEQIQSLLARVSQSAKVLDQWGCRSKLARGAGIAALFSGPPGTGKTMVAGLVAKTLGLELYQVDLSRVISKWVGETEKQLAQIFDAAEAGDALLLFDEADSLFAKRTEVKAAVDRYANLEVNYLLQRIESFSGIAILTTNLDTSIDPALKRRLAAHIIFHPPEEAERTMLWQSMIVPGIPVRGVLNYQGLGAHLRRSQRWSHSQCRYRSCIYGC
jgi:hypothetical protein